MTDRLDVLLASIDGPGLTDMYMNGLNPVLINRHPLKRRRERKRSELHRRFVKLDRRRRAERISTELRRVGSNNLARSGRRLRGREDLSYKQLLIDFVDKLLPTSPRKRRRFMCKLEERGHGEYVEWIGRLCWSRIRCDDERSVEEVELFAVDLLDFLVWDWFQKLKHEQKLELARTLEAPRGRRQNLRHHRPGFEKKVVRQRHTRNHL